MKWCTCRSLLCASGLAILLSVGCGPGEPVEDDDAVRKRRVYDEPVDTNPGPSADLAADRDRMWRTVPRLGPVSSAFEVSPVSAINAAARVFAAVRLEGKTWDEAAEEIGFRPRPGYGYDFPFWPVEGRVVVYRFDCGNFGWQFNLVFDAADRIVEVNRVWIH